MHPLHPRLQELDAILARHRDDVLAAAEAIPPAERDRRPPSGAWTAAENLDHLARIETAGAALLAKRAMRAREAGVGPDRETSSVAHRLDGARMADATRRIDAPELVRPRAALTYDAALEAATTSRAALREAMRAFEEVDATQVMLRHPILGEIDAYQWLLFTAQHELRHARQIDRLRAELAAGSAGE